MQVSVLRNIGHAGEAYLCGKPWVIKSAGTRETVRRFLHKELHDRFSVRLPPEIPELEHGVWQVKQLISLRDAVKRCSQPEQAMKHVKDTLSLSEVRSAPLTRAHVSAPHLHLRLPPPLCLPRCLTPAGRPSSSRRRLFVKSPVLSPVLPSRQQIGNSRGGATAAAVLYACCVHQLQCNRHCPPHSDYNRVKGQNPPHSRSYPAPRKQPDCPGALLHARQHDRAAATSRQLPTTPSRHLYHSTRQPHCLENQLPSTHGSISCPAGHTRCAVRSC